MTIPYDKGIENANPSSRPILESGIYTATMKSVKINQNNEYEIDWDVYHNNEVVYMRQWLNLTKGFHVHHLKCIAKLVGAMDAYEAGTFDPRNYTGRNGRLKVTKKAARDNPGQFRNWVDEIIGESASQTPPTPPTPPPPAAPAEEIPF
tara:strand:- start:2395 stop:2841 length:447 start_codon:yes stop_codon:yes gene_type:complete